MRSGRSLVLYKPRCRGHCLGKAQLDLNMSFLTRLFSKRKEKLDDLPPEFLQETPPDWFIDLKGQELAAGKRFSIRVQLFETARVGTAEILILPAQPGEQPKTADAQLARPEVDRLLVMLGFSFPQDISDTAVGEQTGLPVDILVYRRDPFSQVSAHCDLTGRLDSKTQMPPGVEIGKILVGASQRRALPGI